jgi:hypothetical protein
MRAYSGSWDAFAAKLDSSGALQWNTFLGGSGYDDGRAIAVDGSGNVYVGGRSTATWGSPVRAFSDNTDAFAAAIPANPTIATGVIGGRIATRAGSPVAGVEVILSGPVSQRAITDSQGQYRFEGIALNEVYTVTPVSAGYIFIPEQRYFSILGSQTDASFEAQAISDFVLRAIRDKEE